LGLSAVRPSWHPVGFCGPGRRPGRARVSGRAGAAGLGARGGETPARRRGGRGRRRAVRAGGHARERAVGRLGGARHRLRQVRRRGGAAAPPTARPRAAWISRAPDGAAQVVARQRCGRRRGRWEAQPLVRSELVCHLCNKAEVASMPATQPARPPAGWVHLPGQASHLIRRAPRAQPGDDAGGAAALASRPHAGGRQGLPRLLLGRLAAAVLPPGRRAAAAGGAPRARNRPSARPPALLKRGSLIVNCGPAAVRGLRRRAAARLGCPQSPEHGRHAAARTCRASAVRGPKACALAVRSVH